MAVKKILCVCMGNTCRSPVMEALLRREITKLGIQATVESAGTQESCMGKPANPHSVDCMNRIGIDITEHRSRFVGHLDLLDYDLVVVAEPDMVNVLLRKEEGAMVVVANPDEEGIANPFEKGRAAYDEMVKAAERAVPEILHLL